MFKHMIQGVLYNILTLKKIQKLIVNILFQVFEIQTLGKMEKFQVKNNTFLILEPKF